VNEWITEESDESDKEEKQQKSIKKSSIGRKNQP